MPTLRVYSRLSKSRHDCVRQQNVESHRSRSIHEILLGSSVVPLPNTKLATAPVRHDVEPDDIIRGQHDHNDNNPHV